MAKQDQSRQPVSADVDVNYDASADTVTTTSEVDYDDGSVDIDTSVQSAEDAAADAIATQVAADVAAANDEQDDPADPQASGFDNAEDALVSSGMVLLDDDDDEDDEDLLEDQPVSTETFIAYADGTQVDDDGITRTVTLTNGATITTGEFDDRLSDADEASLHGGEVAREVVDTFGDGTIISDDGDTTEIDDPDGTVITVPDSPRQNAEALAAAGGPNLAWADDDSPAVTEIVDAVCDPALDPATVMDVDGMPAIVDDGNVSDPNAEVDAAVAFSTLTAEDCDD